MFFSCANYHNSLLPPGLEIAALHFSVETKMIEDFGLASLGVKGARGWEFPFQALSLAGTSHRLH